MSDQEEAERLKAELRDRDAQIAALQAAVRGRDEHIAALQQAMFRLTHAIAEAAALLRDV